MKKKFKIIALLSSLVAFGAIFFTGCAPAECEECEECKACEVCPGHTHDWASTWQTSNTQHWLQCGTCSEKIQLEDHKMEFVSYNDETKKITQKCSICDYNTTIDHDTHTLGEVLSGNENGHIRQCSVCGQLVEEEHKFEGQQITFSANKALIKCCDCDYTAEITLLEFNNAEHGRVEVLYETDGYDIVQAIPDEGYYFDEWVEQERSYSVNYGFISENTYHYESPIEKFYYNKYSNGIYTISTLTPSFTTVEPTFVNAEINYLIEGNEEVNIRSAFYKSEGNTRLAIFIGENSNLVLESCNRVEGLNIFSNYGVNELPYLINQPIDEPCVVNVNIAKTYGKGVIHTYFDINGELFESSKSYQLSDENTPVTIKEGGMVCVNPIGDEYEYYYPIKWIDEDGKVISTNKQFKLSSSLNKTLIAVMKKADVVYHYGTNIDLLFSKNSDNTLTLELVYAHQINNLVIPSTVEGLTVTGIGNYAFTPSTGNAYIRVQNITVPETVVNFGTGAFSNVVYNSLTITGDKTTLNFDVFSNETLNIFAPGAYSKAKETIINMTETSLNNMVQNFVHTFVDTDVNVSFKDATHMGENISGHYEAHSKQICVLQAEHYSIETLCTLAHEIRHFYQEIAIGGVEGLTIEDLKYKPSINEVGAWKYLEYVSNDVNFDSYWFNAREIDARNFAAQVMGVDIQNGYTGS